MKILVTGASGYIGTHVVQELIKNNHEVYVIDKSNTIDSENVTKLNIDIFEKHSNIYELVGKPDVCLHMAWLNGFNHMANTHIEDLPKHMQFLSDLVEGGLRHVAVMGTMHEIGYWEGAVTEDTPCSPKSYYGVAKNSLRQLLEILTKDKNISFQWIRAYYITGDDRRSNSIFGKLLCAVEEEKSEFPLNSGRNLYDFIDIKELATQIVSVIEQVEISGIINCCSGNPISLLDKINEVIAERNLKITLNIGAFPDRPYDSPGIWGDNSKIREILKKK